MTVSKAGAWSYSRMKNFDTCPKQYYHVHVLKEFPFRETEATRYGSEFHKAAEEFVRDGTPLPEHFTFAKGALDTLAARPGDKHCELKLGVTADLRPCGFFDKEVWFRGIVDLLIVNGNIAHIVDYKTGKSADYADPQQLELMALAVFARFPEVERVRAGLFFVIADKFIKAEYEVSDRDELWSRWIQKYATVEAAHASGVFNPIPSGLCRKHCLVLECVHNGANR